MGRNGGMIDVDLNREEHKKMNVDLLNVHKTSAGVLVLMRDKDYNIDILLSEKMTRELYIKLDNILNK